MEIPGYKFERLIAEGGTSSVYLALQESLGRKVAIKVLRKFDNSQQAQRFLHEARIIASLEHRNVITIFDVGSVGERYYIAMEYLEGGSLADRVEHGMQPTAALDLLESIASCLEFVHQRDIVHRDIKPGNILFHADGTLKLTDFGIAKQLDGDQEMTLEDSAFGSPYYLSPEQAEGRPLDGRSDIYSLGIVFFQMLTGRKPFAESSHIETIVAHLSNPIPVLPDELARYQSLLEKMIAKTPENRIASAGDLVERIRALQSSGTKRHGGLERVVQQGAMSGGARAVVAGILEASPFSKIIAVTVLLLTVIGIAWLPNDHATDQHAAPAAVRSPSIELRYDGVGTEPESQFSLLAPLVEMEHERIAQENTRPDLPELPPVTAVAVTTQALAIEPMSDLLEEPVVNSTPEKEQVAEAAPAEVAPVEPLQPPAETDAGSSDESRELVEELMLAADTALKANRLTRPANDNALDHYRKVVDIEPGHSGAEAGIGLVADRYAALANRAYRKKKYKRARVYVRRGLAVRPNHAVLLAVRNKLDEVDRIAASAPAPDDTVLAASPSAEAKMVSREFEDTSITSRGPAGTGNMVKDFKNVWRSVFD